MSLFTTPGSKQQSQMNHFLCKQPMVMRNPALLILISTKHGITAFFCPINVSNIYHIV